MARWLEHTPNIRKPYRTSCFMLWVRYHQHLKVILLSFIVKIFKLNIARDCAFAKLYFNILTLSNRFN